MRRKQKERVWIFSGSALFSLVASTAHAYGAPLEITLPVFVGAVALMTVSIMAFMRTLLHQRSSTREEKRR